MTPENASLPPHCTPTTSADAGQVSRRRWFNILQARVGHLHDDLDDFAEAGQAFVLHPHDFVVARSCPPGSSSSGCSFSQPRLNDHHLAAEIRIAG